MKILNLEGNRVNACFVFNVGNCEVSVSTIFNKNKPEIAIFDKYSSDLLKDKVSTVSGAIQWVNDFGPRD